MGGLRKYMPITYLTVLIGAIANAGLPPFAGFFSKDTIIEAVHASHTFGASFAYLAALGAVLAGGFYSFRLVFFAFHGKERFDTQGHAPNGHGGAPHESPLVVTVPLILLAIPSVAAGWVIGDVVFGDYFGASIHIASAHPGVAELAEEFHGVMPMIVHGLTGLPFWLTLAGAVSAWYLYIVRPDLRAVLHRKARFMVTILDEKYGFDRFNDWFFAGGARLLGNGLWQRGDVTVIDGFFVNGSARVVGWCAAVIRRVQSGFLYDYAFAMIIGLLLLLSAWILLPILMGPQLS